MSVIVGQRLGAVGTLREGDAARRARGHARPANTAALAEVALLAVLLNCLVAGSWAAGAAWLHGPRATPEQGAAHRQLDAHGTHDHHQHQHGEQYVPQGSIGSPSLILPESIQHVAAASIDRFPLLVATVLAEISDLSVWQLRRSVIVQSAE